MGAILDDGQIERYRRDGFLRLEGFVDVGRCNELKAAAERIVDGFTPTGQRTVFTTSEQERVSNGEFLASGAGVWCFYEEHDTHVVNKIGHALHELDPTFAAFSYTPELAGVAADVDLADALALQSMYILKAPYVGGEVGCHQDATFLYTDPVTVTGFWFAIEDATLDNGCLRALPGGHRTALRKVFRRAGATDDDGTIFAELDPAPLPDPCSLTPIEAPAGTLVVLHGLLPHWSDVNRSGVSRHAYSLHCIAAAADYPSWNWLQRPAEMPLRRLDRLDRAAAA